MSYAGTSPVTVTSAGLNYPSPYFDIASTYVPPTLKLLFSMTRYFYYSNSIISPTIYRLAEYPVTSVCYEKARGGEDVTDATKELWRRLLEETLHIQRLQIEINLDYYVYGNCFISISYPFVRNLECPSCKKKTAITKFKWGKDQLQWKRFQFVGPCPKCKREKVIFKVVDVPIRNRSQIKIIRWNPMQVDIEHNPLTGRSTYIYHVGAVERKAIQLGKKDALETTPWIFIEAVKKSGDVELEHSNLFHFKRPSISDQDMGWGMPLILPVIKDAYYAQILRKGQEAVAVEHIVPLRILFPTQNGDVSPFVSANLGTWRAKMEDEIKRWRQDPNYISIAPIPAGLINIGGDAKALLITPELQYTKQQIYEGLGVPMEVLTGGATYAGNNVSMRILENHFLTTFKLHDEFLKWLSSRLARYCKIPEIYCRQEKFRMADDIQLKQILMNLQQLGKVSATTLLRIFDLDYNVEQEQLKKDNQTSNMLMGLTAIQNAEAQGQMSLIAAKYAALSQVESQRILAEAQQAGIIPPPMGAEGGAPPGAGNGKPPAKGAPGGAKKPAGDKAQPSGGPPEADPMGQGPGGSMTIPQMVETYAQQIMSMPPDQGETLLRQMEAQQGGMPSLAAAIRDYMAKATKGAGQAVDMRPLPNKNPPRRKNSPV